MSNGSLLTNDEQLSAHPGDLGAWAKLQLGWLDYATAEAATAATVTLNPLSVDSSTKGKEALVVNLPADADGNARYYVVENRRYVGQDKYLENGPYNLTTYSPTTGNVWRTNFPYAEGTLIWYWNTKYANNKTKTNGGYGEILPIDANAAAETWPSGSLIRNRVGAYDAAFGLKDVPSFSVFSGTTEATLASKAGVSVFDDVNGVFHYDNNPYGSSYDADSGTTITVVKEYDDGRVKLTVGASE
jgi:bacillopeptidase F (M6 metalloprotease family)